MTEAQVRLFPALRTVPVYDESDARSHSLVGGMGRKVRECSTLAEIEECLKNQELVPLGGVRCGESKREMVVVFFEMRT